MIRYHLSAVPLPPVIHAAAVRMLSEIFGEAEGALEEASLLGCETAYNQDLLFWAEEERAVLGVCHLTVACDLPELGMLSGFCVSAAQRGRGVGRALLRMALDAFDWSGGKALFLGTDNLAASQLYRESGFAFEAGGNVMYRAADASLVPFYRDRYGADGLQFVPATPAMRVPLIPLALLRGRDVLMDANADLVSSAVCTQRACAGLYPRYQRLTEMGGRVVCVYNGGGMLCAVGSAAKRDERVAVDAFCAPGCERALPELLARCCPDGAPMQATVADCDAGKAADFSALGFQIADPVEHFHNGVRIPCHRFLRG